MDILDLITDEAKELGGVRVVLRPASEGVTETAIIVARFGNSAYEEAMRKELKPYEHAIAVNANVDREILERIVERVYAKTILLGWEGFTKAGVAYPYNYENAVALLRDSKDFFNVVAKLAKNADLFRKQAEENERKN